VEPPKFVLKKYVGGGGPFFEGKKVGGVISSIKFKNAWKYTSTPPYAFMARGSSTGTYNFTFVWV